MDVILKGIGLGLWLSISVGPIVFAIIKMSLRLGKKAGYVFIAGISFSDITMVVFGNMAAELVRGILVYRTAIAICGAALLLFLGFYSFFFKKDPSIDEGEIKLDIDETALKEAPDLQHVHWRKRDLFKIFAQGYFMNILNPGAIFLWLTWSTTFTYLTLSRRVLLFATTLIVVLGTDIAKVALAGSLRNKLTPKALHNISKITALILIGFGVAIIVGLLISKYG